MYAPVCVCSMATEQRQLTHPREDQLFCGRGEEDQQTLLFVKGRDELANHVLRAPAVPHAN